MTDAQADVPQATPDPARSLAVDTPVARPLPKRELVTRRIFILGGFWSAMGLAAVGFLGAPLDFMWPRGGGGFGGPITVSPDRVPAEGEDPRKINEGRFYIVNMEAGETPSGVDTPGGLLALYQKCPHLGCVVPYRPGFTFQDVKGWFLCPCHGSTYTKRGGVILKGPAPRPMDVFTGSPDNPRRAAPYEAGATTPEPGGVAGGDAEATRNTETQDSA
jgi:cytochrome b6-f complex iron-sulfur subunit